ncbi:MAG: LysM peptidoglycan-binding domain-containing protein [Pseudobdellovibrionaceae bacterium]
MNNKVSILLILVFCSLLAQAEDVPPPDTSWDSDPLNILETKKKTEVVEPAVPEFKPVPAPGAGDMTTVPSPSTQEMKSSEAPKEIQHREVLPVPTNEPAAPAAPVANTATAAGSEPDFSKESEFHRIYKTYNEQPTSDEVWGKAIGTKEAKVYNVQKGDTLFGISKTFFGDPYFWPKVWALNDKKILNPHEIKPGQNVEFFPGSMEEAPSLELGEEGKKSEDGKKVEAIVNATGNAAAPVRVAASKKKKSPLLLNLPPSLPQYKMGEYKGPAQLQLQLARSQFPTPLQYLAYYISDAPVDGIGVVTSTELNSNTAGDYQYIYVRLEKMNGDKKYLVQKNGGPISDPKNEDRKGYMVEVEGEIEILERVNDQKNVYRAMVKKTIEPIEVGAVLVPGNIPTINSTVGEVISTVGAKIMGGQFDRHRTLFGSDSLVFLDAGSSQGLQEGQALPIFADERIRNTKAEAVANDRKIGIAKVVKVSQNFATAYIVKTTDDILLGDYVGKNTVQAFTEDSVHQEKSFSEESPAPAGNKSDSGSEDSDLQL